MNSNQPDRAAIAEKFDLWSPRNAPGIIRSAASASACAAGILEIHAQGTVAECLAIESGNGGTRFVAFHFDKAKPLALAGKDIRSDLDGPHGPVLGKQRLNGVLGGVERQVANKHFFHVHVLAEADDVKPGRKKRTPLWCGVPRWIWIEIPVSLEP
jgi:hypothetical protein